MKFIVAPKIPRPSHTHPEFQKKIAQQAADEFNSEFVVGDIIQTWYDNSKWDSTFGFISEKAIVKEYDVEEDDFHNNLEFNAIFKISIIWGGGDFRDKNGIRECRVMHTKYHYQKVTIDDIIEFRKKEWSNELKISIDNLKSVKNSIRRYKRMLNHNERNLNTAIDKAKERFKR